MKPGSPYRILVHILLILISLAEGLSATNSTDIDHLKSHFGDLGGHEAFPTLKSTLGDLGAKEPSGDLVVQDACSTTKSPIGDLGAKEASGDLGASDSFPDFLKKLRANAYGVVNYYTFDWETLPDKRNAVDVERFNLYLHYDFTEKIQFKSEIEFEHGGTGVTMAFDPLEEFGEFEQEVEKGGEVVLEQINLLFKLNKRFNVRVGKMRFYMGNASKQDQPREYFTAYRSEVENTLLPLGWYETGIELSGDLSLQQKKPFPYLSYKAYVVTGLDNTGFSSLNWIRRGYQTRFETINADNLAFALRLDYIFAKDSEIGICAYAGNGTGNRPKNDFTLPAWATYGDVHFAYEGYPWRARAYGMIGHLQNSEALSAANRNLSNNLGVKRTPVAEMAGGWYAEGAYDLLHLTTREEQSQWYVFGRLEWYDSMLQTVGTVSDNPRYERWVYTLGFNYFPAPKIVLKAHYALSDLGSGEQDNTFAMGVGFDF